jgi:hypothetical protein
MTEHPEYPQDYEKLPSLKFIVEQVSKVEDISNCSIGYYAAQKKTADKIERMNVLMGQLLHEKMALTIKKLDDHIDEVHNELITPLWMNGWFWLWAAVIAGISYCYGKGIL